MGLLRGRRPNVEKLERKGNVDGLIRALRYEDRAVDRDDNVLDLAVNVRRAATEALARIESRAAFDGLLRALDDPQPSVRIAAVDGLRERGDPLAVEQLTSAATNWTEPEYAEARAEAVGALAFLRDPTTPRRVAAGLLTRTTELDEDSDAPVLRKLARAGGHDALVGTIADLVARLREGSAPARTRTLLVWLAPDSVEPLIGALDAVPAREEAIAALGETRDSRAVEGLCSVLLGDDQATIRAAAARALGEIRDPAAVEALLLASGDQEYEIRTAAGDSFDKLGNAAIAVAVMRLVQPALENGGTPHRDEIATAETESGPAPPGQPVQQAEPEPPRQSVDVAAPAEPDQPPVGSHQSGPEQPERPEPERPEPERPEPEPEQPEPERPEPEQPGPAMMPAQDSPTTTRAQTPPRRGALGELSPVLRRWFGRRP